MWWAGLFRGHAPRRDTHSSGGCATATAWWWRGQGDPGGSTPGDLHLFLHVSDMGRRNRMFDSEEYLELLLRRFMGGW